MTIETGWIVVVPLKGGRYAKTRLGGGPQLALAIGVDCVEAVVECPLVSKVLVVTADSETARSIRAVGAEIVPERTPGAGLSQAVLDGVLEADRVEGPRGGTAILLGDLPALRPGDLSFALAAARGMLSRSPEAIMVVVPDAQDVGTVLLAARVASHLKPAFGPESFAAHIRAGGVRMDIDMPRLRLDVDTPADLAEALALGVGSRTQEALTRFPEAWQHQDRAVSS